MNSHLNNFTGIYLNQRPAPKRHIDNLYEYTRLSNFDKASDPDKEEGCVFVYEGWREKKGWREREQHIQPEERTTWNHEWT